MYGGAEESMQRLTSADRCKRDSEASFRYNAKNETGLQSVAVTAELLPASIHLLSLELLLVILSLMWSTRALWVSYFGTCQASVAEITFI